MKVTDVAARTESYENRCIQAQIQDRKGARVQIAKSGIVDVQNQRVARIVIVRQNEQNAIETALTLLFPFINY